MAIGASKPTSLLLDYPQLFSKKLEAHPKVRASVDSSLTVVAEILQVSKLPFFPDYTDHGPQHLTAVLEIADKLIADCAHSLFTSEDAAILIFSSLLHDLALHLSEAGFTTLLSSTKDGRKSNDWAELWREFFAVARHWNLLYLASLGTMAKLLNLDSLIQSPESSLVSLRAATDSPCVTL